MVGYWLPSLASGALTYLVVRAVGGLWLGFGVGVAVYLVLFALLAAAIVSADDLSNLAGAGRGIRLVGPVIERALSVVAGVKVLLRSRGLPRAC